MPIPARYNPVPVTFKKLQLAATAIDPDFGSPATGRAKSYGTPITTEAQIVWGVYDEKDRAVTGDPGKNRGHLTKRRSDIEKEGITFNKGDIITSVAGFDTNLEITEVRPSGHLRRQANLIMVFFENNEETNPALRR